ncbi:MAG: pilus assembly protein [Chromatiaceae bacterium]|nr:pilus assembly protein [Chromatiaceae bacterium]MCP5306656.1 pilus assembly protein [Chromatiaceae bacterium]MCP5421843.1 pilus assembly protein [Chromatiaceae bacterium]
MKHTVAQIGKRKSTRGLTVRQRGAEIVEFMITLPVILIVLAILFDFGALLSDQIVLDNAARAAAREVINGATDGEAQVAADRVTQSLLAQGGASLPMVVVNRTGTDPGDQVIVTITHPFNFLMLPGFASSAASINLTATARMNMLPI